MLSKVVRRYRNSRRPSINKNTSVSTGHIIDLENTNLANRPPAPLPDRPVEYVPDENYEDPDALERSREGSLASLKWPWPYEEIRVRSSNKRPSIPMQERMPSNELTGVNPRPPNITHFSDRRIKPHGEAQPPLPQPRKTSAGNPTLPQLREMSGSNPLPGNLPHSHARKALSHGGGQPPVPKPRKASDGHPSQSPLRKMSGDHPPHPPLRKISVTDPPSFDQLRKMSASNSTKLDFHTATQSISEEPPELPGKQRSSVVNGPMSPTIVISGEQETSVSHNPLYATETNRTSENADTFTSNEARRVDRPTYCNLPPPLPEPRKDADGYMIPYPTPSKLTANESFTSVDSHGYIKCFV